MTQVIKIIFSTTEKPKSRAALLAGAIFTCFLISPARGDSVTVSLGSVTYDGYPASVSVPVILEDNTALVGGVQFDVADSPDLIEITGVTAAGLASGFTASYTSYSDGSDRIILYNGSGTSPLPTSADTILFLEYDAATLASAVITLNMTNLVVSDSAGVSITSFAGDGLIEIGNVVSFSMTSDSANINELVTLEVNMDNDGSVGGFQFDLVDSPNYLRVDSVWTTDRTDGFTLTTSELANSVRCILYSSSNENISVGTGAVMNVRFEVDTFAYAGDVNVKLDNVVASDDIGGAYWISAHESGTVTVWPGYLDRPHTLVASSGEDAEVNLTWSLPSGGGGGGGGTEDLPVTQDFEVGDFGTWTVIEGTGTPGTDEPDPYWHISTNSPQEGTYHAEVDWGYNIDTWLLSPTLDLGDESTVTLDFWWNSSYFWHVDPNDNGDLFVKVSTDGGTSWDSYLWTFGEIGEWDNFVWNETMLDLSAYAGQSNVVVAFNLVADDNANVTLDNVSITGDSDGLISGFGTSLGQVSGGIPSQAKRDPGTLGHFASLSGRVVPQDLSGFNIYRSQTSPVNVSDLTLLTSVIAGVTTYEDTDVTNGNDYHYVVTADYGAMGESGPSNEATGTPVEWVELSISNGSSLSGQNDTLDISINNEGGISSFGFVVSDVPDLLTAMDILSTNRTSGWILNFAENTDGEFEVTGYSIGSLLGSGSESVCRVVVRPISQEIATVNLTITSAEVKDANDNTMSWTADAGYFEIDVETQTLMLTNTYGEPGGTVSVSLMLHNTQNIHALQLNIGDNSVGNVAGQSVTATDDISGWNVNGSTVGGTYQVLIYDLTGQNPISPGFHHLVDIEFAVSNAVPAGTMIDIIISDISMTDANSVEMYVESQSGQVGIGDPEAIFSISDVETNATGHISGFSIGLENTVTVGTFELKVMDMPNALIITNVTGTDRLTGGYIDASSGEIYSGSDAGYGYILGYFATGGISPGSGAILDVDVYIDASTGFYGNTTLMVTYTSATDANQQAVYSIGMGYGTGWLNVNDEPELIPETFSVYQNYPNPFNPSTTIRYDLPEDVDVSLAIYDMVGREVKILMNSRQTAGRKSVVWDGTDAQGRAVSNGVYFYRLTTNDVAETRKMLLMK